MTILAIEYDGKSMTTDKMLSDLKTGHASYHHWYELLKQTYNMYNTIQQTRDYGVLLNGIMIHGISVWELNKQMLQGVYDKERLVVVVKMHKFLVTEIGVPE